MINCKNLHCDCGVYYTPPKEINSIANEHYDFCVQNGYEYREAIIEQNGNQTIVKCPVCGKEGMRVN